MHDVLQAFFFFFLTQSAFKSERRGCVFFKKGRARQLYLKLFIQRGEQDSFMARGGIFIRLLWNTVGDKSIFFILSCWESPFTCKILVMLCVVLEKKFMPEYVNFCSSNRIHQFLKPIFKIAKLCKASFFTLQIAIVLMNVKCQSHP